MSSKSFLDLEVWQKSHDWVLGIYQISAKFPKEELFGLTSQLRRAAISVPANISEGFKRTGVKDKIRFYNIAQASPEEVRYYLILARDLCYLDSDQNLEKANEIGKMLESYVKKIKDNHPAVKF